MHPGEAARDTLELPILLPVRRRSRLPSAPGTLFGRHADVDAARDLLANRKTRLLTLVGPPGVGKTRLALQVAATLEDTFEQGAVFVDLSPLRDAALVLDTVAQAFGLRQQGSRRPADQLDGFLQEASVLLVLDNLEHLLAASADVARMLAQSPGLVVLATSRTALNLRWERVYDVAPLPPDKAVEMFVDRAQACRPDYVQTTDDTPVLAEICARLDGLPLAIELAAARCILFSPHEILNRLGPRLDLLSGGPRDASVRHQTLRGAIEWSCQLLPGPEQRLFRRLAVFVGSFSLEAAEAVAQRSAEPVDELLGSLLAKSLVRFEPSATPDAESRFRLLETLRAHAWDALTAARESDAAIMLEAEHYRDLLESRYPSNFGPEQTLFGARIEREYPNLRQVLAWTVAHGEFELALRIGGGLHWFWYAKGYLAEGIDWLDQALAGSSAASDEACAVGRRAVGALLLNQGKFAAAIAHLETAVSLGRRGDPREPRACAELAMALGILGVAQIAAGSYDAASKSISESLATFEAIHDEWGIATAQEVLGAIAALCGDPDEAERLAAPALEVHRRLGGRENIARTLDVLGYAAALRGDLARAEACFDESLTLRRIVANRPATAAVLGRLGLVAYLARQWDRATTYYRESLALAQEVGDDAGVVRCLGQIAALGLACGVDRARVARLGCAVQHHQAALGLPSPPVEQQAGKRLAAAIRAELSPLGLAAAWVGGRVLSIDQAVQLGSEILSLAPTVGRVEAAGSSVASVHALTRREAEVAALVERGLTNRQIAEELVIAQRTVDTHVERILSKLGFSTRTQIAAWSARQRQNG
jgi:non-specific serine/threonine protein kinase